MNSRVRGVAALLFFSGACALVYQVAWFRELRLVFGASTASSAAVLAIFMGGLGLGGARLGKRADASPNPLAMYAKLEIAVACAAGATPALVWLTNTIYIAAGGSTSLGSAGALVLRVLLSTVVLGPATLLMGGTLPAAARAVERDDDGPRRSVATLYGVNTLGAVVGAVLANFLLLEVLGTRLTLWMAALVNVLVGVVAQSLARRRGSAATTDAAPPTSEPEDVSDPPQEAARSADAALAAAAPAPLPRWFAPAASALAGGSFMLMELVWYRMLGPLLGGSSYTFGLILAVALAGIAIGGIAYARLRVSATPYLLAMTCSLEALFIAIPYAAGDRLAVATALTRSLSRVSFASGTAVWTVVAAIVVLPAAIVSGFQFPLIIGLYGRGARGVGRDVGAAYLANTLGSIAGSIAGGFGLVPMLGALGSWKLVVVLLSTGATVAALVDFQRGGASRRRTVPSAALACVPILLLLAVGPTAAWRHAGIGAGRADRMLFGAAGTPHVPTFLHHQARDIRWEEDGIESSVALSQSGGFNFVVNGKSDGHATVDAPTQVMSGLLAALVHGKPTSALVVGLGTGSTAGWLGAIPSIERVDVVELERAILRVARDCAPVNERVMDNPKVHIHIGDAREHLRTTNRRYDVIFSEPSNPYRAGISSLYTVEYYRAALERVAPGGIFVQWMQAYEVDGWAVATAVVTLRAVFGDVEVWRTMTGDLLLLARATHVPLDVERLRKTLESEPYARAARAVWRTDAAEGVLSHFVARSKLADVLVEKGLGAVNSDDQNFLEFAFARSVGQQRRVDSDLASLSRRLGTDEPDVAGNVDWSRVQDEGFVFQEFEEFASSELPPGSAPSTFYPVIRALSEGRSASALKQWRSLDRARTAGFGELALVAEVAARVGSDDDKPLMENAPMPEREALRAIWSARHGDHVGASDALVRLFVAARTTPWIRSRLLTGGMSLATEIAKAEPGDAQKLHDALVQPFAIEAARDPRLVAVARIASSMPDPATCVRAFAELEPPPWDRSLMELRVACYRRANHPRLAQAEADLLQMLELDTPLGASIPTPPRRPRPGVASARPSVGPPDAGPADGAGAMRDAAANAAAGTTTDGGEP